MVIALAEEFDYFLSFLQCSDVFQSPEPKQFWDAGHCFWAFDLAYKEESKDLERNSVVQVVAYLVAEMGTEYTGVATSMLVTKWHVPFIVNIGVTGSLDKDLKVGSILMPTQITHYTANTKIRDDENGKEILIGTRAFATSRVVVSQFANFLASSDYKQWQEQCMRGAEVSESVELAEKPELHIGHLASGNVVIDSEVYKKELKSTDRKLMACEMEAAGFMIAEQFLQASARAVSQFISLRCISDMAANKHTAESGANKIVVDGQVMQNREWAMRNATMLFMFLVDRRVINADITAQLNELGEITRQLSARKKETARRPLQCSQTALQLITNITLVSQIQNLDLDQCATICGHLNPDADCSRMNVTQLRKQVRLCLDTDYPDKFSTIKRHASAAADGRVTKVARVAEVAVGFDAGPEVSSRTSIAAAYTTPARSTASDDRGEDTQLDDDEGNLPLCAEGSSEDMVSIRALQKNVDELSAFFVNNAAFAKVSKVVYNRVSAALKSALNDLEGSVIDD